MNKKGFTLVELLATLVILGIIVGITIISVSGLFKRAKEKSEDIFVDTIKDAMDMYLNSKGDMDEDLPSSSWQLCSNTIDKTFGSVKVYKATTYFSSIINSQYNPITQEDLVNPANENVSCNLASNINVNIYRDDDYVYYYSITKDNFGCLKNNGVITNLPEGFEC